MAHSESSEEYSSPYQFFYLYYKRSIQIGDVIKSAKLIDDQDRLIVPNES
ncbi:hypothetical protein SAY87_010439 [Trapa incisa]|uniref:Uncharacterized protein n=1 Tax=Trapa incisa TaxID=236973 RepID=A0AAN7JI00_9MYRT|nr:hypothetical protein SAY87_010439 [Trapa incisa]